MKKVNIIYSIAQTNGVKKENYFIYSLFLMTYLLWLKFAQTKQTKNNKKKVEKKTTNKQVIQIGKKMVLR